MRPRVYLSVQEATSAPTRSIVTGILTKFPFRCGRGWTGKSIDKFVSASYSVLTTPIDSTVGSRPPPEAASVFVTALLQSSIFDTDYSIIGILDRLRMQEHVGRMIRGFKQQSTDKDVWLTEAQARLLLAHIPYAFPELADEYAISQQSLIYYGPKPIESN